MAEELSEDMFEEGCGFDGSSIRGFQAINESDMLLFPDPTTALIDPVCKVPTLSMTCNIKDPITLESYTRDVRHIAQKAEAYLQSTGIADESFWGPEAEFYLLNDIRYGQSQNSGFYHVDSVEGSWNSGREENPNLGYKPRYKEGYFPVPPSDTLQDLRSEICLKLMEAGMMWKFTTTKWEPQVKVRLIFVMVRSRRQAIRLPCISTSSKIWRVRTIWSPTFMPKPLFQDNGSGMHVHQSLWKDGKNVFYDPQGYSLLSEDALYYIGGLLAHARSLCAIIAPTTNSYKRLVPGYEAPVNIAYSQRNRSACVRIPVYSKSEKAKRVEFRTPDPSCNPYLAFSALLMAGLDGIQNRIHPGDPLDKDLYDLEPEELADIESTPVSLGDSLDALEEDHEYLLKGDVFTQDVLDVWIDYKRENEVDAVNMRPHPYEFFLYHDI